MGSKKEQQCVEAQWQAAQAALRAAQKLPNGAERVDALRKVGQLRYDADKRRRDIQSEDGKMTGLKPRN